MGSKEREWLQREQGLWIQDVLLGRRDCRKEGANCHYSCFTLFVSGVWLREGYPYAVWEFSLSVKKKPVLTNVQAHGESSQTFMGKI